MSTRVRDLMRPPVTAPADVRLTEVARRMLDAGCSAVVMVDEAGEASGIISVRDLVNILLQRKGQLVAEDVMRPVNTVSPAAPVAEAARQMVQHHLDQVVIVHDIPEQPLRPVGILVLADVLSALLREVQNGG